MTVHGSLGSKLLRFLSPTEQKRGSAARAQPVLCSVRGAFAPVPLDEHQLPSSRRPIGRAASGTTGCWGVIGVCAFFRLPPHLWS
jgi:hypothetical protein